MDHLQRGGDRKRKAELPDALAGSNGWPAYDGAALDEYFMVQQDVGNMTQPQSLTGMGLGLLDPQMVAYATSANHSLFAAPAGEDMYEGLPDYAALAVAGGSEAAVAATTARMGISPMHLGAVEPMSMGGMAPLNAPLVARARQSHAVSGAFLDGAMAVPSHLGMPNQHADKHFSKKRASAAHPPASTQDATGLAASAAPARVRSAAQQQSHLQPAAQQSPSPRVGHSSQLLVPVEVHAAPSSAQSVHLAHSVYQPHAVPTFDQQGGVALIEAPHASDLSMLQSEGIKVFQGSLSPEALLGLAPSQPLVDRSAADASVRPELREAVHRYLEQPSREKTVIVLNSKVAQKSYGSEKRFFCPPPSIILVGDSWRRCPDTDAVIEPVLNLGIEDNGKDAQQAHVDATGRAVFKNLFISDADKRRNFALYLKVLSPSGREFGVFRSRPIKVISKPSKKKQSAKNIELCITSGTTVSLFNRIRSQTVSTKYLGVENGVFVAKTNVWDAFVITAHNKKPPAHGEDTFLHYGMEVVMRSTLTGMSSGVLVVRKVEKSSAVLHSDEPVSQLHKVAFQIKDSDQMYLALVNDSVSMQRAIATSGSAATISDAAAWTIVGTERVQYSFFEAHAMSAKPATPVPIVDFIKVQNKRLVEVYGENFSPALTLWFAETPAVTRYRCEEFLVCEPPPYALVAAQLGLPAAISAPVEVPILLVRNDGVVYNTGKKYIYTADPFGGAAPTPVAGG